MTFARYALAVLAGLALAVPLDSAVAQDGAAGDLAAQARAQGHRCDAPVSAQRDAALSKPDQAVWVLKCANAGYRLRLIPDKAASVEPIK